MFLSFRAALVSLSFKNFVHINRIRRATWDYILKKKIAWSTIYFVSNKDKLFTKNTHSLVLDNNLPPASICSVVGTHRMMIKWNACIVMPSKWLAFIRVIMWESGQANANIAARLPEIQKYCCHIHIFIFIVIKASHKSHIFLEVYTELPWAFLHSE